MYWLRRVPYFAFLKFSSGFYLLTLIPTDLHFCMLLPKGRKWSEKLWNFLLLLRGWLRPSLAISRRVIPVTGRHNQNWQYIVLCPPQILTSGSSEERSFTPCCRKHPWVNRSDTNPLPWRSLCRTVSFGIRQAVWMGCHRRQETSGKKVKSEIEKAVISSGLSCLHVVWERQLMLHFRWRWMLHLAVDALTFLLRACVCSQWRSKRYFGPPFHC